MPTTPLSFTVKLYQLEENVGGTDLQKKSSPAEVQYSSADPLGSGFRVLSMGGIDQSIEIDKGVYQIDGVSLQVDGLASTFFNAYDDPKNEPYVCEIYDVAGSQVLFHGPIDRASISYDARTGYTEFDVNSWLYVLEQTEAAARSVYETQLSAKYSGDWNGSNIGYVTIQKVLNGVDMSAVIQPGDVVVLETGAGEWRTPIWGTTINGDNLELLMSQKPGNLYVTDVAVGAGSIIADRGTLAGNYYTRWIKFSVSDITLWTALNRFHNDPDAQDYVSNKINVFIEDAGGDTFFYTLTSDEYKTELASGRQLGNDLAWSLDEDGSTVRFLIYQPSDAQAADFASGGLTLDVGGQGRLDVGKKLKILGREVYGFIDTTGLPIQWVPKDMQLREIIEGMFSLSDLGVMSYVADTFTYPVGWDPYWKKFLEYPNKLIESLREIQNTEFCFFRFTPTLDGSLLPRMTVEVIPRTDANVTDRGASTLLTGIIDYKEESADNSPTAVYLQPSKSYLLPKAWNHIDHAGFWFGEDYSNDLTAGEDISDLTTSEVAGTMAPSKSAGALSMKANWTPTYTAVERIFPSNKKSVMNDPIGRQKAARFFEFYKGLPRTCSFKYNGQVPFSLIGGFVNINEGGLARTIFVNGINYDPISDESEISGRVGTYTYVPSATPTAIIDGVLRYTDSDAGGDEDIQLSGVRSFDPDGQNLTYSWVLDPLGAATVIGTAQELQYTAAVGTHTIRLTVDNGTSSGSTDVVVKVVPLLTPRLEVELEANFQTAPALTIDASGNVFVTLTGDLLTADLASVKVDYSLTSASGPWTPAAASPFANPVSLGTVYATLAEDTTLWVRVTLVNYSDAADSPNTWVGQITNTLGAAQDSLTVNTLFDLNGDFDMDGGIADEFSVSFNGFEYILSDVTGTHFYTQTGDTFDVTHNSLLTFEISDSGVAWDIATGDTFTWDINSVLQFTLSATAATFVPTVVLPASTTSKASMVIPTGARPTTPTAGDVWEDGDGLHYTHADGDLRMTSIYGSIYVNNGTTSQGSIGTTPTKVTGFVANGPTRGNVTSDHTTDSITVNDSGDFKVGLHVSFSGSTNARFEFHIRINGTEVAQSPGFDRKMGAGGDVGTGMCQGILTLASGDVLTVYVESDSGAGSDSITISHADLSVISL